VWTQHAGNSMHPAPDSILPCVCTPHSERLAHCGTITPNPTHVHTQDGLVKLPDLTVTDKNDTFHCAGDTFSCFRLLAVPVRRDATGRTVVLQGLPPAVSNKFVVSGVRCGWTTVGTFCVAWVACASPARTANSGKVRWL
jgi:hypothetical protein